MSDLMVTSTAEGDDGWRPGGSAAWHFFTAGEAICGVKWASWCDTEEWIRHRRSENPLPCSKCMRRMAPDAYYSFRGRGVSRGHPWDYGVRYQTFKDSLREVPT